LRISFSLRRTKAGCTALFVIAQLAAAFGLPILVAALHSWLQSRLCGVLQSWLYGRWVFTRADCSAGSTGPGKSSLKMDVFHGHSFAPLDGFRQAVNDLLSHWYSDTSQFFQDQNAARSDASRMFFLDRSR